MMGRISEAFANLVKMESGTERSSIIPAWQRRSDASCTEIITPLRPGNRCQLEAMVPGTGQTQPLAKAITLHTGLGGKSRVNSIGPSGNKTCEQTDSTSVRTIEKY